jgi:hypothetical protein
MADCNMKLTPLPLGVILTKDQSPKTQEDHIFMADKLYQEVLGSIMYAQIGTQPDLSYAVSTLSKYVSNLAIAHWHALMHVLQYIKATLNYKITYSGNGFKDLKPTRWVNASYGGDLDSQRSCAGYVFLQAGGLTAAILTDSCTFDDRSQVHGCFTSSQADFVVVFRDGGGKVCSGETRDALQQ